MRPAFSFGAQLTIALSPSDEELKLDRRKATLTGFIAIKLWALLALFTVASAPVPALQLNAMCFAIGGSIGLIWGWNSGTLGALKDVDWRI
jgi:hypothetical protein